MKKFLSTIFVITALSTAAFAADGHVNSPGATCVAGHANSPGIAGHVNSPGIAGCTPPDGDGETGHGNRSTSNSSEDTLLASLMKFLSGNFGFELN